MENDITTISGLRHVAHGGIKSEFIDGWLAKFRQIPGCGEEPDFELTSLQRKAANDPRFFEQRGQNLVITGPTSSGKTLVAETLMANHFTRGTFPRGCIFAVPLKALLRA